MMAGTGSIEPAAREVFGQLDGQTFDTPAAFGTGFDEAVRTLGRMPWFWSTEEAIDCAGHSGWLTVKPDGRAEIHMPPARR